MSDPPLSDIDLKIKWPGFELPLRRPDVDRDRKHFRHDFGQFRENFQTTRPSNPAALHRLLSPFARISRQVRK